MSEQVYLPEMHSEARLRALSQFHTPPDTAKRIAQFAVDPFTRRQSTKLSVLEPSAGDGALVKAMLEYTSSVCTVEIDERRRERLEALVQPHRVHIGDFLQVEPDASPRFDIVVSNPPFEDGQYEAHIMHALRFAPVVVAHIPLACWESAERAENFWPHVITPRMAISAMRPKYSGEGGRTPMATFHFEACARRDIRAPQRMTAEIWT